MVREAREIMSKSYWSPLRTNKAAALQKLKTEVCARQPLHLLAGEALEVGHLAFHLLAGGVGSGADALDAQLEFVGVRGAGQSFVDGDELLGVEIEERLIEGLHAVLAGAGGDGVVNQARFVRIDDAVTNVRGGDHDLDRKSTRLNSSHEWISYAVFCLKKKRNILQLSVFPAVWS